MNASTAHRSCRLARLHAVGPLALPGVAIRAVTGLVATPNAHSHNRQTPFEILAHVSLPCA